MMNSCYQEWNERLSKEKIADIRFYRMRARYPRLHGKNARLSYHGFGGEITAAAVTTESGMRGWGELCTGLEEAKKKKELLLGRSLTEVFLSETGILDDAYKAFDIALHDLAGNILQIPVCRMLDPDASLYANVYDGAIYMNDIIPEDKPFGVEQIVKECGDDIAIGHTILKVKIGRGSIWMDHDAGLKRDIEVIKRIHEAYPAAKLMVDANDGYSVEDTIAFLEGIRGIELVWFEEPFREEEGRNRALKEYLLKNRPMTYIADGESFTDIDLLRDLSEKKIMDVWQPDVCGQGFTSWRALMKEISEKGWLASPHAWGSVTKTHYCAHLAAAWPHHIPCVESVLGTIEGVDISGYVLSNGVMNIPDRPGFGMELIWAPEV